MSDIFKTYANPGDDHIVMDMGFSTTEGEDQQMAPETIEELSNNCEEGE